MNKQKRRGLKLQPCFTPLLHVKHGDRLPLTLMHEQALLYISFSSKRIRVLRPKASIFNHSRSWLILSNALLKSTKQENNGVVSWLYTT